MQKMILRLRDVEDATGLRKSAIYSLMASGDFPAPVRLTGKARGWRRADIERWCENRPRALGGKAKAPAA